MKKGRILKILFALVMIFSISKVKAAYNGSGSPGVSGSSWGSCTGVSNCQYENRNPGTHPVLQIQLIYASGPDSDWEHIGATFYVTAPGTMYDKITGTFGIKSDRVITIDGLSSCGPLKYDCANKKLIEYFGDDDNYSEDKVYVANENLKKYLNRVTGGNYSDELTKDTEPANRNANTADKQAKKGYRIIIEPALFYVNASFGIISPKDIAYKYKQTGMNVGSCSIPVASDLPWSDSKGRRCSSKNPNAIQGSFLYTDFWDIGVEPKSKAICDATGYAELSRNHNGCGMNIIDVGKYIKPPECYDKYVSEPKGTTKCDNTYDTNNEATFTEEYKLNKKCTQQQAKENTNTVYGKLVKETDDCSLYCIESAKTSLPAGIKESYDNINVNSHFAWPARKNATYGLKMFMESTYKCTVVQKNGKTCSNKDISSFEEAAKTSVKNLKMAAKLTGGNFEEIKGEELVETNKTVELKNVKNDKKDNVIYTFTATRTSYFKINENTNRYFSEEKNAVSNKKLPGFNVDRGEGFVSLTEKKTEEGKSYPLSIDKIELGSGNQFGKFITDYTCTFIPGKPCVCPEGTLKEGEELYVNLTADKTCTQLQQTYCNICSCPSDSAYGEVGKILNDQTKDIVGESMTSEACTKLQQTYCYEHCTTTTGEKILLSGCTNEKMKADSTLTKAEATRLCEYEKGCICEKVAKSSSTKLKENYKKCLDRKPGIENADECYRWYCKNPCPNCDPDVCYDKDGKSWDITQCISDEQEINGTTYAKAKDICTKKEPHCNSTTTTSCGCPSTLKEVYRTCKKTSTKTEYYLTETWTCNTTSGNKKCSDVCHVKKTPCKNNKCSSPVVYRTIDLDNPFPASNQKGTTTRYSNTGTAGREPGKNWNSEIYISQNILIARGVKGNKLYEKKPLYTIVLTPQLINEIKTYNKKNSYDDFKLTCKNVNGTAACVSNFVHTNLSSAIDRNKSVSSCLEIKTEAGFKACYEKNN